MSIFDLNSAEVASGGDGSPIPEGTIVRAAMTVRPGGAGDGGWFATSPNGTMYIDVEMVVTEGPFAKRRFWPKMYLSEKAAPITMRTLRAIVESHLGIRPDDMSEAAQAKRRVSVDQLNGFEACFMLEVEDDGVHKPKNGIKAVIMPGDRRHLAAGQAAPAHAGNVTTFQAPPPAQAPAAAAGIKPSWA